MTVKPSEAKADTKQRSRRSRKPYRQNMANVHTWFGLLVGWLLFLIFIMGTVSFFNQETTTWMHPEIIAKKKLPDSTISLTQAYNALLSEYPNASSWYVAAPTTRSPISKVYVQDENGFEQKVFDTTTGKLAQARDTKGGNFFYYMHFDLHYMPSSVARIIIGFAAMMMLIALITGVIVHKKIFVDFFTFRWGKGQRSWLDAHNLLSVFPLPFHFMITFTGIITLVAIYMPWGQKYSGIDEDVAYSQIYSYRMPSKDNNLIAKKMMDVKQLLVKTKAQWQMQNPHYDVSAIRINNPNTSAAKVIIDGAKHKQISDGTVFIIYDGITGETLETSQPPPAAVSTHQVMVGLHAGRYSDVPLRWLYFFMGAAGTGMIATGLVLWTVKRRMRLKNPEKPHIGFVLVERLNIATIAGLPLAMISYFWFNRLLPLEMASRADWEIHGFFMVWGIAAALAMTLPASRAWQTLLALLAATLLLTPIMNAMTTQRGFIQSVSSGDLLFISYDVFFMVTGIACVYVVYALKQNKLKMVERVRAKAQRVKQPVFTKQRTD